MAAEPNRSESPPLASKAYPAVIHTQGPIGFVLELRQQVAVPDTESVRVTTYGEALRRKVTDPAKGDPETREPGHRSISYLVPASFPGGGVTSATFAPLRIRAKRCVR